MVSLLFCNWVHSVYCRGLSHGEEADQLAVADIVTFSKVRLVLSVGYQRLLGSTVAKMEVRGAGCVRQFTASVACAIAGARGRLRRETNTINGVALGADMSYAAKYFQLASCVITVACLFEVFPNVCKL